MITVILYTRSDCHLCEDVVADLEALSDEHPHQLVEIDIDSDPALQEAYGEHIPVVEIGPYVRRAPITRQDLIISLSAARDRESFNASAADSKSIRKKARLNQITTGDRLSMWIANHYMLLANILVFLYVGLSFLAPVFMKIGWTAPATIIYRSYSLVCHNLGYRSWFLFGEQAAYPRSAANVPGLETFAAATNLGETSSGEDIFAARRYVGNEQIGYKVAFCERDVAIYLGILFFGLLFALSGRKIPGLHWVLWIVIGIGPIALDGLSQLLSQPPFNLWDYRESTPLLRTLTGGIFGFMTAWYGFPIVDETMRDAKRALLVKFKRIGETVS